MAIASVVKYECIPFEAFPDQASCSGELVALNNFRRIQCSIIIPIKPHPDSLRFFELAAACLAIAEHAISIGNSAGTSLPD
jgi:hypothetical protein